MTAASPEIQRLLEANPLREPLLRSIIQSLRLPQGSRGLDVGCGIGLQTMLLADAVAPGGQITGVDLNPELLSFAIDQVAVAAAPGQINFQQGNMHHLPFPERVFDWAWSADCIGYPVGNLDPQLKELARVVKPGGSITILAWTSQQVLPGYPLLEASLNAACSSYAPYLSGQDPQRHFFRALRGFKEAGLGDVQAQTFVGEVHAPLSAGQRTALVSLFEMLWVEPSAAASLADWEEGRRLCTPGSPDFLLDLPEYYAFFTYTLFRGKVPLDI